MNNSTKQETYIVVDNLDKKDQFLIVKFEQYWPEFLKEHLLIAV